MRKRRYFPKKKENLFFQSQMDESKTPGGDQELRTSTLIRPRPIRGEDQRDFLGESEGSLPPPQDLCPDAKFIPMPQAMKIPAAKAAVDKEWEKLEKIPTWNLTKVRSKKEVIDEARTKGARVHFASLMDICHLKKCRTGGKAPKNTKVESYGGVKAEDGDHFIALPEEVGVCARLKWWLYGMRRAGRA